MTAAYNIVIPARMASTRLPGKPLLEIAGRPLIEHVYRRAQASAASRVVIATDSADVAGAARGFGAEVVLTSPDHASGSDRIAECAEQLDWADGQLLVNLQGDEPLMPPRCLDQVAEILAARAEAAAASLYWPLEQPEEIEDPNVVKVVVDDGGRALYFSRATVPHARGRSIGQALAEGIAWKRHVGLYAYRAGALREFAAAPPAALEIAERLEQLRFLAMGRSIVMAQAAECIPAGVDTPEDLDRARRLLQHREPDER